jgi:maltose O-acetyltransferase
MPRGLRRRLDRAKRRAVGRLRGEQNVERLVAQGLQLGSGVYIGQGVFLDAGHPWLISIGEGSVITSGSVVLTHDGATQIPTGLTRIARVVIGKRVFVGAGAVILPGAHIGDDSIIGSLTVVRGEIPPASVVVGNPGQVVSTVEAFAERHLTAAAHRPVWPQNGWMAGRGINETRKAEQLAALADGSSGYLRTRHQEEHRYPQRSASASR